MTSAASSSSLYRLRMVTSEMLATSLTSLWVTFSLQSRAAVYAAARQTGTPRSIDEVANVSRIDEMEFKRTYRYIVRELNLQIQPADPEDYVARFASDLGISDESERRARELLRTAKRKGLHSGKSPVGLAAAAIYAGPLLTNEKVTQAEVSEVAQVSEVTIRNRYHELLEAEDDAYAAA